MRNRTLHIIVGSIILLLLVGIIGKYYLEAQIKKSLIQEVEQRTSGLYRLEIGSITVGFIHRSIKMEHVRCVADSTALLAQQESHFITLIEIEQLKAKGVHWHKIDSALTITCKQVTIQQPTVHFSRYRPTSALNDERSAIFPTPRLTSISDPDETQHFPRIPRTNLTEQRSTSESSILSSPNLTNRLDPIGPEVTNVFHTAQGAPSVETRRRFARMSEKIIIENFTVTDGTVYEYERIVFVAGQGIGESDELEACQTVRLEAEQLSERKATQTIGSMTSPKTGQKTATANTPEMNQAQTTAGTAMGVATEHTVEHAVGLVNGQANRLAIGQTKSPANGQSNNPANGQLPAAFRTRIHNGITLQTGSLIIDLTPGDNNSSLSGRDLAVDLSQFRYALDDGDNQLSIDSLHLDTHDRMIRTVGLSLLPQLPQSDYAELSHNHGDWTQLETATTVWSGVDFPALVKERIVSIDTIKIQGAKISSYKNRQVPQPQREKQLLSQTIRELPVALRVGCIDFGPLDIIYQELSPEGTQPGTLTFQALTGQCLGLTNRPEAGAPPMSIHLQGQYLGKAPLQADFHFPLQDSNDRFTVKGRLGTFDLQDLNPLTEPLANLEIQSGQVDSLLFTITGDATQSSVDLKLLYHNLDVALIKVEEGKILQRRLLSEAIEDWILLPSNPQYGITRTGTGTALRAPYKSQFNYLWRSLWPGLKSTLIRHRDRNRTHDKERW